MYYGKHHKDCNTAKQSVLTLFFVLLFLSIPAGAVYAYLYQGTDSITNIFEPGIAACAVVEEAETRTSESKIRSGIHVKNTGDVDSFIRVRVVTTWKDENGYVYSTAPVSGTDYIINIPTDTGWFYQSPYYYYCYPVSPNETTGILIDSITLISTDIPDGYTLSVEVLANCVQNLPTDAVEELWGITVTDGLLKN